MTQTAPAAGRSGMVTFPSDGVTIRAFFEQPERAAVPAPAILILHEWWGLNEHMQDLARRFRVAGYAACVPDLYSRQGSAVTRDPTEAARLMEGLSSQHVLRDLNAATAFLTQQPFIDPLRIGIIGFCMGGTLALTQITHNSDLKAAVVFYGKVPPDDSFRYLLCPVLYHYGAQDGWVTSQEVERLRQGLARHGKSGRVVTYPQAGHAFFNDTRPEAYRASDAADAWQQTLQFFSDQLR